MKRARVLVSCLALLSAGAYSKTAKPTEGGSGTQAAPEAELANMTKGLIGFWNGVEVREKYGDRSAEALLKNADEVGKLCAEGLRKTSPLVEVNRRRRL